MTISQRLEQICGKILYDCSDEEIYSALVTIINEHKLNNTQPEGTKKLYYISAEFLIGKLLVSNLINLGIYDEVKETLEKSGKNLDEIEQAEAEPSLGNGGLGRLAACFLDSIASLDLCGDGIGLFYHFGLFKQRLKNKLQCEEANPWIPDFKQLKNTTVSYITKFGDFEVKSQMHDIDIIGAKGTVNSLHLFDIDTVNESLVKSGISYDKTDIKGNLTLFLYPDDSDENGKLLRLYQEYFMVSNAAQLVVEECENKGCKLYDLHDYAVIQINDTHPTMIIPELIRILCNKGLDIDIAIDTVTKTCAYTNHTILAEALETWPLALLKKVVPQLIPIIEILDNKIRRLTEDSSVYIIDKNEQVHMAHIDIHYTFSTNGVASLHTEILKNSELSNFYKLYPQRFNNKTNGITFRRWLRQCNNELDGYICSLIGEGYRKDSTQLKKLLAFSEDKKVLDKLIQIKHHNKLRLEKYIANTQNITINENSVFDIQIKRLHEYKRQQMNILYYINKYLEIKEGKYPLRPVTGIFGGKAAPGYTIAKDIIHLIMCMQELIKKDKDVSKYLNIVMIENYNVTAAQYLIPACDISEQISLSSKEASGTGNMKLMLNGAITLGTEDGANVEIHQLVGDDNIYIFGSDSREVIDRYKNGSYSPLEYYENTPQIKQAIDFITSKQLLEIGYRFNLERLKNELITKDWFMTLPDFISYTQAKERALSDYENREQWAKKMLINIANAGFFSSDRTIEEYNNEIWKLN